MGRDARGPGGRGNSGGAGFPPVAFNAEVFAALLPVEVIATLRLKAKKKAQGPEGPKHKEWNARYRKSLGLKLKKLGFKKTIIAQIFKEYAEATVETFKGDKKAMGKFILKWLFMLIKVRGAIKQEYKEEGPAPKWGK
jgi:hypothetical protein